MILDMDQLNNLSLLELKERWNFYLNVFETVILIDFS